MASIVSFVALISVACATGAYATPTGPHLYEELYQSFVDEINSKATTWKAGYNPRFAGLTRDHMARMLGAKTDLEAPGVPKIAYFDVDPVPETFDIRQRWPACALRIGFIRDQSDCGSCWAVSSAAVMSDRICIKTNGNYSLYISDEDILTCCTECGDCQGGWPSLAFKFWDQTGVVSGGPYNSNQGCRPYSIKPCPGCPEVPTPQCDRRCRAGYSLPYERDENKGASYYLIKGGEKAMQQEIMTHGSIVACFTVYDDFYHYTSGVYQHVSGKLVGGHAVRVVGWGVENNVPYWTVANSWNATWGMQGYFKILRGKDECGFESQHVAAGLPL